MTEKEKKSKSIKRVNFTLSIVIYFMLKKNYKKWIKKKIESIPINF